MQTDCYIIVHGVSPIWNNRRRPVGICYSRVLTSPELLYSFNVACIHILVHLYASLCLFPISSSISATTDIEMKVFLWLKYRQVISLDSVPQSQQTECPRSWENISWLMSSLFVHYSHFRLAGCCRCGKNSRTNSMFETAPPYVVIDYSKKH